LKVLTFLLMMLVAMAGTLLGYRAITGRDLITPPDFNFGRGTEVSANAATPVPTLAPTPQPTPTPRPTPPPATPTVAATPQPEILLVGNTGGAGVYIRSTPDLGARVRAYVDGTRMTVLERNVEGGGQTWIRVRAPDGTEGFIPQQYLVSP
jgi:hypothetical protein